MTSRPSAALLLLGHGSTLNADSSAPTYQHAEALRRLGLFSQVAVGFWKEEPNFRQALRQMDADEVCVVPNFISSGYFTEQIIPRELRLPGPVTQVEGRTAYLCPPVGLHLAMEEALIQRAQDVVASSGADLPHPEKTACLFICGHGTNFNDNSTKIIYERAASIKARGLFADCQPVLMEQKPFVKKWRTLTDCPDVIVVPFFIADGLHSYDDIPVLLGLTQNVRKQGFTNPNFFPATEAFPAPRRLWYGSAIGTEPFITQVIVQQIERFQQDHPELNLPPLSAEPAPPLSAQNRAFRDWLSQSAQSPARIAQVLISATGEDNYEIRHEDDFGKPTAELTPIADEAALRKIINFTAEGRFRPLHAARTLVSGWIRENLTLTELRLTIDYFYPAAVSNWFLHETGGLEVTNWRETAERQTGRFKIVKELDDHQAQEVVEAYCQVKCGKIRLWSPASEMAASHPVDPGALPLLCPEACNPYVGKAREKLKGPEEES